MIATWGDDSISYEKNMDEERIHMWDDSIIYDKNTDGDSQQGGKTVSVTIRTRWTIASKGGGGGQYRLQ